MTNTTTRSSRALWCGVAFTLFSSLCLALMSVCAKRLSYDVSNDLILVARFLVSLVMVLPFLLLRPKQLIVKPVHWPWLITRSTMGLFSIAACFYCMQFMPVANAVLLMSTAPIYVPLLVWLLFGIKTRGPVLIGIVVSLVGVGIVLHPADGFHWSALIGLFGGLSAAVAMVVLRHLSKSMSANALLFYYYMVAIVLLVVFLPFGWKDPHPVDWGWMLATGLFGMLYQWGFVMALRFTQIRIVAPLSLSSVVFSGLLAWVVWQHVPGLMFWAGAAVMTIGIVIVIDATHRRSVVAGELHED